MKKLLLLKSVLLLCALIVGSVSVWAETTVTFTAGTDTGNTSVTKDGITVSMSTMSRDDNYRTYANTDMTVTSTVGNITKVEVTCTASGTNNNGPGKFSGTGYSYSGTVGTWSGTATKVTLSASAQVRMTKIEVTYAAAAPKYALTFSNPVGGTITVTKGAATVSTGDEFEEDTELNIVATPAEGYDFTSWTAEGATLGSETSATTTLTMPAAAVTLSATFTPQEIISDIELDNVENGTIAATIGGIAVTEAKVGDVVTLTAAPAEDYSLGSWLVLDNNADEVTVTTVDENTATFVMPATKVTVSAEFLAKHTVTCNDASNGSVSANVTSAIAGATITLTTTPATGYSVASVSVVDADENTVTLTKTATNTYTFTMPSSNVIVSATFTNYITDVLNQSLTGVTGTTYTAWSNKSCTGGSGAVYAGQSAAQYSTIQLRSNNSNSGVITTKSGGKVKKVVVDWNTNTDAARVLNIYGKNSAYSSATELYSTSTQGTLLGTMTCNSTTNTELEITGDYAYIGIRSNSGAMWLNEIDITWEPVSINISAAGWASFSSASEVAIPEGVTAYYAQQKDETTITLKEIDGGYIPANTGVVVSGAANSYAATITATDATLEGTNLLQPWLTAGTPDAETYYTLAVDNSNNPVFKESTGGTLTAGKAYLVLPSGVNVRELSVVFDSETTGITSTAMQSSTGQYYDLQGRRIAQPAKGLYIVNGRKVVIR